MIKEAVQYLVGLGEAKKPVEKLEYAGRQYTDSSIVKVDEPLVTAIHVSTLSGLGDLLGSDCKFEGFDPQKHLIHVVSHLKVQVVTKGSNPWKAREVLVTCEPTDVKGFEFDQFHSHEKFTIGLLSNFAPNEDRENVLRISSNVTGQAVVTSADDGVSQKLTVNQSVTLKETVTIRTVSLAPYRTFREVEQPLSDFILRAKQPQEGAVPHLALFEADGGKWKIAAVENIARHLRTNSKLDGVTIVS